LEGRGIGGIGWVWVRANVRLKTVEVIGGDSWLVV
jgi:hypothetical protein